MWIAELSRRSNVPVPTIKFYLREGLLAPGEAAGVTRAHYSESHVRRLRLIRALVDVADMRLDAVRTVLDAVDDDSLSLHEVIGSAHSRLSESKATAPSPAARDRVDALLARHRWKVQASSTHLEALARALDSLDALDHPISDEVLDGYAVAMAAVAERELATVPSGNREAAAEQAVIGTVLLEPVIVTLRRLAHENLSSRRFRRRR